MSEYDYNDPEAGLPDASAAAQRLEEFVSWFGDGDACSGDFGRHVCHTRDIEAVFTAYRSSAAPSKALRAAASYFAAVNVRMRPSDVEYVVDFLNTYAEQLEGE